MKLLGLLLCVGLLLGAAPAGPGGARLPYAQWKHGPPADPGYFPIAVWLQNPNNAERYKAAGINLYVGLWQGPTEEQLAALRKAGMPVICSPNAVGMAHKDDPIIVGWMHGDEPDNAQEVVDPQTGQRSWGPCIPPERIVKDYEAIRRRDPSRPVLLNLGQGVANDGWVGRGPGAKLSDYETYVLGGDIISYDVYPVAGLEKPNPESYLWYVAKGVDRLRKWTGGRKVLWNCIECTQIGTVGRKATPHQVRAEVWMSIIHGSRGLIYFVHQFAPSFNEHALLDDPEMLKAVTALNRQIRTLAPVINRPDLEGVAAVTSSAKDVPIDLAAKRHGGATYVFAVGMRNAPTRGSFEVRGLKKSATAEVLGEGRTLKVTQGRFEDDFRPYDVHLYRIR